MKKLHNIYILEFINRLVYSLFSYLLCWVLFFVNTEIIFIFETIPLLNILTSNRLIITHITQLFNTIWFYSLFLSSIFVLPLIVYHIKCFMISGWYKYQIIIYKLFSIFLLIIFSISYIVSHFFIIPSIIAFFLYWEIKNDYSLLKIEAEISLLYYIIWSLTFKLSFSWVFTCVFCFVLFLFYFLNINYFYKLYLKNKKLLTFFMLVLLFILIPPDFIIQIFLTLLNSLLIEFFFFLICIKLKCKIKKFRK